MAKGDGRGGLRRPRNPAAVSGPGKLSRRTDSAVQPIREPDIDSPGLQYGDRKLLTEGQRIARLPRPTVAGQASPHLQGEVRQPGGFPPFMFEGPSNFPDEPVSAGLPMGPGPGPEALSLQQPPESVPEETLIYLANYFGNADAAMVLSQLREERARAAMPATSPTPQMGPELASGTQPTQPQAQPTQETRP